MEGETRDEPVKDLDELQNADWVRLSIYCTTTLHSMSIYSYISNYITLCITYIIHIIMGQFISIVPAGTVLGTGDERSTGWCQVEEGSGTSVQPTTY